MNKAGLRHCMALLALMMVIAVNATAATLPAETRWADPSSVELNVAFPGNGYHASWELFRCSCGDLLVRAELAEPGKVEKGDLLFVSGKAVLTRGFGQFEDDPAATLDTAALMMQLALRLLERSEPGGPSKINGPVNVELTDAENHLTLDTGYAVGEFQAPWSIEGTLSAPGESVRKFDLRFTFSVGSAEGVQQAAMRLTGVAEFAMTDFPVSGSSAIGEWELGWRNESDAIPVSAETLDELRAQLLPD